MRSLLVTHYFPPEVGAPQARLSEMAKAWAQEGDDLTVLTAFPNHPTGIIPPSYRGRKRMSEQIDGYRVVRTWVYATPNERLIRKTLGHISFMVSSVLLGTRVVGPADVVIVSSPTFFSIFSAWFLSHLKRAKFVIEVRDLWPAIFVELGVLRNRWLIKVLEAVERAMYRAADMVVVVSEGFRDDLVRRGIPADKVHVIRNGVDLERFIPSPTMDESARVRLGAKANDTLVLYAGAHGISHALLSVAETARDLRDEHIHFAFVGDGAMKGELRKFVADERLENVTLLSSVARDEVPTLVAAADVCIVPLRRVPLFTTFIPSKMFEFMASGKAIVGALEGEAARILSDAGAVVVPPEDPQALAAALRELARDPVRRAAMGERARAFVAANFDRVDLANEYRKALSQVVGT